MLNEALSLSLSKTSKLKHWSMTRSFVSFLKFDTVEMP